MTQISIVILTFKRPQHIRRALRYWSQYPVDVVVLDGSPESCLSADELSKYTRTTYIHREVSVEERLLAATHKVTTPYALCISDDEFACYSALLKAVAVLDADPNVSGVLGATLAFRIFRGKLTARLHYLSALELAIDAPGPSERLDQRLSAAGNSVYYLLARTTVLQLATQWIGERAYSCPYISEYQMEAVLCAAGQLKVLKEVFWFRNQSTPAISHAGWDRRTTFDNWCEDPANRLELGRLVESADEYLAKACLRAGVISGSDFVAKFREFERLSSLGPTPTNPVRKALKSLPAGFKKPVRGVLDWLRGRLKFTDVLTLVEELRSRGISSNRDDILNIKQCVED